MMPRSVAVSSAEVASSQIKSFGDLQTDKWQMNPERTWTAAACNEVSDNEQEGSIPTVVPSIAIRKPVQVHNFLAS